MKGNRLVSIFFIALMGASAFPLQALEKGTDWSELSTREQRILKRYEGDWINFSADKQLRLQRGAKRWSGMSKAQRKAAAKRFKRWQSLNDEQRRKIRKRFQRFKSLAPEQQRKLRAAKKRFQSLPAEKRRELRERWKDLTPAQKRRVLSDISEGSLMRKQQNRPIRPVVPKTAPNKSDRLER